MNEHLMKLDVIPDIHIDAALVDAYDKLLFLSVWGRDTAIQEFLAGISLANDEGGINSFYLNTDTNVSGTIHRKLVLVGEPKRLDHYTGRMPASNVFGGDMTHLWVFDKLVTHPDLANRRTIALSDTRGSSDNTDGNVSKGRIWQLTKAICHLPLLDHWAETVIKTFYDREWIKDFKGISVNGAFIDLSNGDEVEEVITQLIQSGALALN